MNKIPLAHTKSYWATYIEATLKEAEEGAKDKLKSKSIQERAREIQHFFLSFKTPQQLFVYFRTTRRHSAKEKLEITTQYENAAFSLLTHNTEFSNKIGPLIKKVQAIDQKHVSKAENTFRSILFCGAGVSAWALGAFAKAQWLITIGKISLFISGCLYGFNWLTHRRDQTKIQNDYQVIKTDAEEIQKLFELYNDKLLPAK
jgi:hypothetical protein